MARKKLTADDYAGMANAAEELARGRENSVRGEMNKTLSNHYRALSVRQSVAAEKREESNNIETTV
ncbi:hypothetical protein D9M71_345910 [compost metagenome]